MEEADRLGDRVAVMAKGRLKTIGTPDIVKQRHGLGLLRLVVEVPSNNLRTVSQKIQELVPEAEIEKEEILSPNGCRIVYTIPEGIKNRIPRLTSFFIGNGGAAGQVSKWDIFKPSLEDVFYKFNE